MPVPQKQLGGKVLVFENNTKFVEKYSCNILKIKTSLFHYKFTYYFRVKTKPFQIDINC